MVVYPCELYIALRYQCCLTLFKITLTGGNAPMQVDGEPWEQHPAEITITHHNVVSMMAGLQPDSVTEDNDDDLFDDD